MKAIRYIPALIGMGTAILPGRIGYTRYWESCWRGQGELSGATTTAPAVVSHLPVIVPLPLAHLTPSEGSEFPALNHRRAAANIQRCSRAPETCGDAEKKHLFLFFISYCSTADVVTFIQRPGRCVPPPHSIQTTSIRWTNPKIKAQTEYGLNVFECVLSFFLCVSAGVSLSLSLGCMELV